MMQADKTSKPDDFPSVVALKVRVLADDVPRAVRVRQWLKAGLRSFGIRVLGWLPDETVVSPLPSDLEEVA